jgi:hypothetical protein
VMVKFIPFKTPTQAPLINAATPFIDKTSPSGLSHAGIRMLQSLQAQQPLNPIAVASAQSPLIVDAIHNVLFITTGAGAFSLILGQAKSSPFSVYVIIKADAGAGVITVNPNGADTINGGGPLALTSAQWRATILITDGNKNWWAGSIAGGG